MEDDSAPALLGMLVAIQTTLEALIDVHPDRAALRAALVERRNFELTKVMPLAPDDSTIDAYWEFLDQLGLNLDGNETH